MLRTNRFGDGFVRLGAVSVSVGWSDESVGDGFVRLGAVSVSLVWSDESVGDGSSVQWGCDASPSSLSFEGREHPGRRRDYRAEWFCPLVGAPWGVGAPEPE